MTEKENKLVVNPQAVNPPVVANRRMIVYLNGRFLPDERALISVYDRGFLYGDGLFETLRIYSGHPFLWNDHMNRFALGAHALGISLPLTAGEMRQVLQLLLARNHVLDAIARVTLSRGVGLRGYSPREAGPPTFMLGISPAPNTSTRIARIITSRYRIPAHDPLSAFKHANKLLQIMARAEADASGADEAVLLNDSGHVMEGTSANFFWVRNGILGTAPQDAGALPGITRQYVLNLAQEHNITVREESCAPEELKTAEGLFLTSSGIEIMEISHWDGQPIPRSPIVRKLQQLYRAGIKPGQ